MNILWLLILLCFCNHGGGKGAFPCCLDNDRDESCNSRDQRENNGCGCEDMSYPRNDCGMGNEGHYPAPHYGNGRPADCGFVNRPEDNGSNGNMICGCEAVPRPEPREYKIGRI